MYGGALLLGIINYQDFSTIVGRGRKREKAGGNPRKFRSSLMSVMIFYSRPVIKFQQNFIPKKTVSVRK